MSDSANPQGDGRRVSVAALAFCGPRHDTTEDRFALGASVFAEAQSALTLEWPVLLAVADGMGGGAHADQAAQLALSTFASFLHRWARKPEVMAKVLNEAVLQADAAIAAFRRAKGIQRNMGCTLAGVWLMPGACRVFHCGDSRVYRFRTGQPPYVTRDHRLENSVPRHRGTRLGRSLTRALGGVEPQVEVQAFDIRPGDRLLICSDGVHDALPESVIVAAMGHETPGACVDAFRQAFTRHTPVDDTTGIVAFIPNDA